MYRDWDQQQPVLPLIALAVFCPQKFVPPRLTAAPRPCALRRPRAPFSRCPRDRRPLLPVCSKRWAAKPLLSLERAGPARPRTALPPPQAGAAALLAVGERPLLRR